MTNNTSNNHSFVNWALAMAVVFLLCIACKSGSDKNTGTTHRYYRAPYADTTRDSVHKSRGEKSYSQPAPAQQRANRTLYRGPRGGCYYLDDNGNKVYVNRRLCN